MYYFAEGVTVKVLNRHSCYRIKYIVYNLLIPHPLQYKYLHFTEILDEIIVTVQTLAGGISKNDEF